MIFGLQSHLPSAEFNDILIILRLNTYGLKHIITHEYTQFTANIVVLFQPKVDDSVCSLYYELKLKMKHTRARMQTNT